MAGATKVTVNSYVWLEDPVEAWIDGEVTEINGEELKIKVSNGKEAKVNVSKVHPKDPEFPKDGVADMTKLSYLHEPGVLRNLKSRFVGDEIYTYTGNILIAVNPFKRLPHYYTPEMMKKYNGAPLGELSPHPYAISYAAYKQMVNEKISQSILVSGESGAGKTESTKNLMQYLAYMGGRPSSEGKRSVEQQVLESNPVLEAFGNAKTLRNNNSSRFGKFVEIQFNDSGKITGAAIRTYLLERSRVTQVSDPERNYHCFYMLCGAPPEESARFKVGNPRKFHYLNQSNFYELNGVDETQEYLETRKAMAVVGINPDEQDAIFRVVAAILHLGNIEFGKGSEPDSSQPKDDQARFHLTTAADLFQCDKAALEDSFCNRVIVTRGESIKKCLDVTAATISRDAFAKIVYSKLFDWIVNRINDSIGQDANSKFFIGVLDIYGFESFKTNSFEQFCINLTNEKLQQHFNQHVFKMEQEEYTREAIDWSYIQFEDNQDILDLIEKKPGGILALLDEACMFPRSTHETFAQKLYQTFTNHKRFNKPKLAKTDFTICHYAGDVTYQSEFFLDKNKDYVVAEHQALLNASTCSFVAHLFPPVTDEAKSSKFSSIGSKFKQQLQSLLETLSHTEPHYVRCVKPNTVLKPDIFENLNILQQLRCGGVLEAIRISTAGFPTRKTFHEFIERFKILAPDIVEKSNDDIKCSIALIEKAGLKGYQIGKTKIFLRTGQMSELDACRAAILGKSATKIQSKFRSHITKNKYLLLREATKPIQSLIRGQVARHRFEVKKRERRLKACLIIQKDARMYVARRNYRALYCSAIRIQAKIRGLAAAQQLLQNQLNDAATVIQTQCRRDLDRLPFLSRRTIAIISQSVCRRWFAQKEAKKRRVTMEAKLLELAALEKAEMEAKAAAAAAAKQAEMEKAAAEKAAMEKAAAEKAAAEKAAKEAAEKQAAEEAAAKQAAMEAAAKQAALEAAAIQAAMQATQSNSKFEEQIQELTTQLEEEKKARAEMEEAKDKEIESLRSFLKEITEFPVKEDGAADVVEVSKLPKPEDIPKTGNETVDKLTAENVKLKYMVNGLQWKFDQTQKLCEERSKQAEAAESMVIEMKISMQSLQEKLSDLENEEAILRQQVMKQPSSPSPMMMNPSFKDNGQSGRPHSFKKFDSNLSRSAAERQNENVEALLGCVKHELGFSKGKPVATYIIYKSLLQWKIFEAERTSVFDRIIHMIGTAIQKEHDNKHMAYWLSTTSTLLFLLHKSLSPAPLKANSPSFFGKITQGFHKNTDLVRHVEGKYPALLFKQQLTAYVEKIYAIIRDNVRKDLTSLLSYCLQEALKSHDDPPPPTLWGVTIACLDTTLHTMKNNFVAPVLVQKIITEAFACINVQLFNIILQSQECCTYRIGDHVKYGLVELEQWCARATWEYSGSSPDELQQTKQAVGFLVSREKYKITYDDLTTRLCPVLGVQQHYRLCTLFVDDHKTGAIHPEVINKMKVFANNDKTSYLLDDNCSVPFSTDELDNCFLEKDFAEMKPSGELLENPNFKFLNE